MKKMFSLPVYAGVIVFLLAVSLTVIPILLTKYTPLTGASVLALITAVVVLYSMKVEKW